MWRCALGEAERSSRRREQLDRGCAAGQDAERGLVGIGLEGSSGRGAIGAVFGGPRLLHHVGELVGEDVVTVLVVSAAPWELVVVAVSTLLVVLTEIDRATLEIDVFSAGEGLLAGRHLGAVGVDLDIVEAAAERPLHAIESRCRERVVARSAIARGWGTADRLRRRPQFGHGALDLGDAG